MTIDSNSMEPVIDNGSPEVNTDDGSSGTSVADLVVWREFLREQISLCKHLSLLNAGSLIGCATFARRANVEQAASGASLLFLSLIVSVGVALFAVAMYPVRERDGSDMGSTTRCVYVLALLFSFGLFGIGTFLIGNAFLAGLRIVANAV